MPELKRCKKCGKISSWNSYFGGYMCECGNIERKAITNGDRIRAMADYELADFLSNWGGCNKCKFRDTCTSSIGSVSKICKEIHLEWLKQPAG